MRLPNSAVLLSPSCFPLNSHLHRPAIRNRRKPACPLSDHARGNQFGGTGSPSGFGTGFVAFNTLNNTASAPRGQP
jgi:hypothetical protein